MRAASTPVRVALTSLGCKVNFAEMAELAGKLAAAGCDVVPEHEHAEIRVLNSCTVTTQADATTRQRLARLRRMDPDAHIVLTGCSVDANPGGYVTRPEFANLHSVPTPFAPDAVFDNSRKVDVAAHVLQLLASGLSVPPQRSAQPSGRTAQAAQRARAFIKVQDGCDHACTYCIVSRARGRSRSVDPATVLAHVDAALTGGQRELVLCGVDLGSYGRDTGTSLAALLARVLDAVGTRGRVRLSSINANDVTADLIELNAYPRLCAHWHMPLQSGSDSVLKAMHRGYRRAQYLRVVRELRARKPETAFTTDVLVGFPGETDTDHCATLDLVSQVGFSGCHVFRYSPRPDTPAAGLPARVDAATSRRRSAEVQRAAAAGADAARQRAIGLEHEVVWDAVDGQWAHGLTSTYLEVFAQADSTVVTGSLRRVRAERVDGNALHCTLLPR